MLHRQRGRDRRRPDRPRRDGIRQWRRDLESKYTYTVEVTGTETAADDTYVITTTVKGNFPGSPVELKYEFVLSDGLVDTLRIAP